MDVRSLYIIKRDTGVCMYHKDFTETIFDADLISSFLVAMTSFFDEASHSMTSKARAFEGTDYKIVVEFGEWTVGAISVSRDSQHLRTKLKRVIKKFEEQFSLLRWVEMDLAIYSRFEPVIMEEFVRDLITEESVVRTKLNWDLLTSDPEVVAFLNLIPDVCTVKDAAVFLEVPVEIAMNLAAKAFWEKAVTIHNPIQPDDIFQATSLTQTTSKAEGMSPEMARILEHLDGETPIAIAAERIKTSDLKNFLEEIEKLVSKQVIEQVSPTQEALVINSNSLQEIISIASIVLGFNATQVVFDKSREALTDMYSWLAFVTLEDDTDVEIKSSLVSAAVKGSLSPEIVHDGFRALIQFITKRMSMVIGKGTTNRIIEKSRIELEQRFPKSVDNIDWLTLKAA